VLFLWLLSIDFFLRYWFRVAQHILFFLSFCMLYIQQTWFYFFSIFIQRSAYFFFVVFVAIFIIFQCSKLDVA